VGHVLVELGERYWALGLPAAARSALSRALGATDDAQPALRLTEIALAQGDARAARAFATEAARRAPGAATKIVLARAQLAAGELAAARMSLGGALDARGLGPLDRARASSSWRARRTPPTTAPAPPRMPRPRSTPRSP
jgi:hypothetical protein